MKVKPTGFIPASEYLLVSFTVSCFLCLCLWHQFFWFFHFEICSYVVRNRRTRFVFTLQNSVCCLHWHTKSHLIYAENSRCGVWVCNHHLSCSCSLGVYPGQCSWAATQHVSVCFSDYSVWLFHFCKPPRCSGHVEVQVFLQGPRPGVLLHRWACTHDESWGNSRLIGIRRDSPS